MFTRERRQPDTDEALLKRLWSGDRVAFARLYQSHPEVYRFALQMSGSVPVAEEVTQEVFLALFSARGSFDPAKGELTSYLYGAVRNQVRKLLERDRRYVALEPEDDSEAPEDDALSMMTRQESIEAVRAAVLTLPGVYREVVVLCELHEQSYAQAAKVLGCAIGTVRSRLHRARSMLAQKLSGSEATMGVRAKGGHA